MKLIISSLIAGLLFGFGLALSKMIEPTKVLNFLDITGNWDPSLALVMGGALSITFVTFRLITKRTTPIFDTKFRLPKQKDIDKSLVIGTALFGIGWGMAGYCPGPVFSSLGTGLLEPVIFVLSMFAGFIAQRFLYTRLP